MRRCYSSFKKYISIIIVVCILSLFEVRTDVSYYNGIMAGFFGLMFPNLSYLVLAICAFDLISIYDKNYFAFLRFNNKKEYLNKLLDYCFDNLKNIFIILTSIFLILSSCYYFINSSMHFNIIDFIYIIYSLFKVFVITELLIKIGVVISKGFSKKVSSLFLAIIILLRYSYSYSSLPVNSFSEVPLFYGYFYRVVEYNSIFLDLFSFILQIIILLLILEIIKYLVVKYKKIYIEE